METYYRILALLPHDNYFYFYFNADNLVRFPILDYHDTECGCVVWKISQFVEIASRLVKLAGCILIIIHTHTVI